MPLAFHILSARFLILPSLAVVSLALSRPAPAADAFSNIEGTYDNQGYVVSSIEDVGYRFTSALTGTLSGFTAAINNFSASATTPLPFTFSLYSSSGADTLGALLGSYAGSSTGSVYNTVDRTYTTVPASGSALLLTAGTNYWLVASSEQNLIWNWVDDGVVQRTYFTNSVGAASYGSFNAGSFSVQVNPVPEPSALACGLAGSILLLLRRRK